jgi:hypothetical protein
MGPSGGGDWSGARRARLADREPRVDSVRKNVRELMQGLRRSDVAG